MTDLSLPRPSKELDEVKEKLNLTQLSLQEANSQIRKLRQRVSQLEGEGSTQERLHRTQEILELVMQANRDAAQRIRDLERGVCDRYLREQIDPWDMKPTKAQCEQLLRIFTDLTEREDEE